MLLPPLTKAKSDQFLRAVARPISDLAKKGPVIQLYWITRRHHTP